MCHLLKTHRGGVDLSPLPLVHTWVLKQQPLVGRTMSNCSIHLNEAKYILHPFEQGAGETG